MKRILTVTLVSGKKITRDVTYEKIAPVGAPMNDEHYMRYCAAISQVGFNDPDTNEKFAGWIAPSQIKSVSIKQD